MTDISAQAIFYPVILLVFFTIGMAFKLFFTRRAILRLKRVHPQKLRDGKTWDEVFQEAENISDAFENLFEVPVLFYAVVLAVFMTGHVDSIYVVAAWVFLLSRVVQGWIHCTSNIVLNRAMSFGLSLCAVGFMWARFGAQLILSNNH